MLGMMGPYSSIYASCGVHALDVESAFAHSALLHEYASHELEGAVAFGADWPWLSTHQPEDISVAKAPV